MSDAISAQGTKLYVNFAGTSPATWVLIPEVKSIGGPSETADEIEVTHLGSTGGRREYIQGFKDADDCPVEMNYLPGNTIQAQYLALYDAGTVVGVKEEYPDGATNEYDMFLKGRQRGANVGDPLSVTAVMRITGDNVFVGS